MSICRFLVDIVRHSKGVLRVKLLGLPGALFSRRARLAKNSYH